MRLPAVIRLAAHPLLREVHLDLLNFQKLLPLALEQDFQITPAALYQK